MNEPIRFIAAVQEDPRGNFTRLCHRFGVSRAKGYKWVARYEAQGPAGLEDKPPVARTYPHKRTPDLADLVVELRKKYPFDGPKKLRQQLLNPQTDLPSNDVPAPRGAAELPKSTRGVAETRST